MAKVSNISIDNVGGPYDSDPTITISAPTLVPASATITGILSNNKLDQVIVNAGGSYYIDSNDTSITVSEPDGLFAPASLSIDSSDIVNQRITNVTIDSGGSFYIDGQTSITVGEPQGYAVPAAVSLVLDSDNKFSSITVDSGGFYFTTAPAGTLTLRHSLLDSTDSDISIPLDVSIDSDTRVQSVVIDAGYNDSIFQNYIIDSADVIIAAPTGLPSDFIAQIRPVVNNNVITDVNILDGGRGYTVPPVVTASYPTGNRALFTAQASLVIDDGIVQSVNVTAIGNFYETISLTAAAPEGTYSDFTAQAICTIDSSGQVETVTIVDSGNFYTAPPTVTFTDPPNQDDFIIGDTVTQTFSDGTKLTGEIISWNDSDFILELIHVGASDGQYHTFTAGGVIVASTEEGGVLATGVIASTDSAVEEDNQISENEQNTIFDTEAADFLDFSETNPFGEPN